MTISEAPTETAPESNLQDTITELEQRVESLLSGISALDHRLTDPSSLVEDVKVEVSPSSLKDRIVDLTRKINIIGTNVVNIENYLGV